MSDLSLKHKVGQAIRSLRREKGLSQEELAELSNINRTYVGTLERGDKSPTLDVLERIAKALDITVGEIMKRAEGLDV